MKVLCCVLASSLLLLAPGCRPKENKGIAPPVLSAPTMPPASPAANPHESGMPPKNQSKVIEPEWQKGKFKAIKISVTEIASRKERIFVVPLDRDFPLAGTGLSLRVIHILTHFGMGGGVITSRSEKMTNPAAQVKVMEEGQDAWLGWLFTLFPDAHAFQHKKYTIKLLGFVPA